MLTVISVLVLIFALVMVFVYPSLRKEDVQDRHGYIKRKAPHFLLMWDKRNRNMLFVFGLLGILLDQSTYFAREGNQYWVLSKTGQRTSFMTPGLKFMMPFSDVQEWSKFIDIKAIPVDSLGNPVLQPNERLEDIEGPILGGVKVRFSDRVAGDVYLTVRFELPSNEDDFIKLVETYKSPRNLINIALIPTISEQLTNVSYMYSADQYVSGAASDYKATIEDALKFGGFVVKQVEFMDTIYAPELLTVDSLVSKPRRIQEIRKLTKNTKVLENGIPKRTPHEINISKIITASVIISDVDPEGAFMDKLTQQRDLSAEKIIEIQKIETAAAAQLRIIAEGERDKAKERVDQEKAQVSKLINIETQVKEEESKRQLAEIAVQTAELQAKATLTRERAQAEANRLKVAAGLTPQEKALWEYRRDSVTSANLSKMSTPQIVIMGADGKGGGDLTNSLIQAEMAKKLLNKQ